MRYVRDRGLPWWLSGKESTCIAGVTGNMGSVPGSERSLEEGMATLFSILAWRIPWTEELVGYSPQGHRVEHDWVTNIQFSWVDFSCSVMSDSLLLHGLQHARPPCPWSTPGAYSNSCPLSWWCHPVMSSSVVLFSSCPQSLPASESFPMSQLFAWGGQSTGVSALASFLPKNTQGRSPLEWTGWIPLQSKGLSRVFSNTTVQKHQFFGTQLSSESNSHIHTWQLEKP